MTFLPTLCFAWRRRTIVSTTNHGPGTELSASAILAAFLGLAEGQQVTIRKRVSVAIDPERTAEQRRKAETAIVAALRLSTDARGSARPLSDEERLSAAHRAVRERVDREARLFADTLARLLAERQMTQGELARRIGVGQSAISMMLSRQCRPQPRTLGKLADALAVPVEELWPGKLTL
jgi:lambda repressor-like predicted transcriptional regulator